MRLLHDNTELPPYVQPIQMKTILINLQEMVGPLQLAWDYKILLLVLMICKKVQQTIKIPVTVGYFSSHCSISTQKSVKLIPS